MLTKLDASTTATATRMYAKFNDSIFSRFGNEAVEEYQIFYFYECFFGDGFFSELYCTYCAKRTVMLTLKIGNILQNYATPLNIFPLDE